MQSYFILDCQKQQKIADSLYGYYIGITANKELTNFWNPLTRREIQDYFLIPNNPTKAWFDELGLKSYSADGTSRLLTHVIFHPVQKSLNRLIQIDYTVRIQSLTGFNEG